MDAAFTSPWILPLTAVALSMDACAVAAARALCADKPSFRHSFLMGITFGVFQGVMPCLGWLLGSAARAWISSIDHWVVFLVLAGIGAKMIWEAFQSDTPDPSAGWPSLGQLMLLGLATSIDALAVGVGFAAVGQAPFIPACVICGVTAVLSIGAALASHSLGSRFGMWAEIAGGLILIGIGSGTLWQHLAG